MRRLEKRQRWPIRAKSCKTWLEIGQKSRIRDNHMGWLGRIGKNHKIYLGSLYFSDIVTRQNIPKIEIILRMAMHDRMETAVWTKSEWSLPIDTSNDSSFITSFMNLKMDFLYGIYSIGQVLWVTEVRKHQNILKKRDYFLGEFDFWSSKWMSTVLCTDRKSLDRWLFQF